MQILRVQSPPVRHCMRHTSGGCWVAGAGVWAVVLFMMGILSFVRLGVDSRSRAAAGVDKLVVALEQGAAGALAGEDHPQVTPRDAELGGVPHDPFVLVWLSGFDLGVHVGV